MENNIKSKSKRISEEEKHSFFGYYNLCPWNKSEKYIVHLEVPFIDHNPTKDETANIVLYDTKNDTRKVIAKTYAWCWQQGCMLQWLKGHEEDTIIYNDRKEGKFVSVILNIKTGKEKIIPFPIYSVHPSGKYAVSVNFSRLRNLRSSYGYEGVEDEYKDETCPEKDGIYVINLETGKYKLIISLKELSQHSPVDSMNDNMHWVEHLSFSPDGKRFCFFYRWNIDGGLFHTRLMTATITGKDLFMFPDSGLYSHVDWRDNKTLFGWGSVSEKLGSIRKDKKKSKLLLGFILPIYRKVVPKFLRKRALPISYFAFEDKTGRSAKYPKIYNEDGHSTFSPKGTRYLITDTYPDSREFRKLILYDFKTNKRNILDKFYALPNKKYFEDNVEDFGNSALRADLHPRWDRKGEKIAIDSVHEGYRGVYVVTP